MQSIEAAHRRYLQQSAWTSDLRKHLISKIGLRSNSCILEIGSGTSAILGDFASDYPAWGIDLDMAALKVAHEFNPDVHLSNADGHNLPLPANTYDLVYCHFLLLRVADPAKILAEMKRVTRPGGWIIAFAEPDYGSRIDFPGELEELGAMQAMSLENRGADPNLGRRLSQLFASLNLKGSEIGIMGMQRDLPQKSFDLEEQRMWQEDIAPLISSKKLERWIQIEGKAIEQGKRIQFVPTFFALGQKE